MTDPRLEKIVTLTTALQAEVLGLYFEHRGLNTIPGNRLRTVLSDFASEVDTLLNQEQCNLTGDLLYFRPCADFCTPDGRLYKVGGIVEYDGSVYSVDTILAASDSSRANLGVLTDAGAYLEICTDDLRPDDKRDQ